MTENLQRTLIMVADALAAAREPWWIIGSAAVALHRAAVTDVCDVDLLLGLEDAERLLSSLGLSPEGESDHPQFRSELFAVWRDPPLPVDIFASFHLRTGRHWRPVTLHSREAVTIGGRMVFTPSVEELHRLLLSFGRPKDIERASKLVGR